MHHRDRAHIQADFCFRFALWNRGRVSLLAIKCPNRTTCHIPGMDLRKKISPQTASQSPMHGCPSKPAVKLMGLGVRSPETEFLPYSVRRINRSTIPFLRHMLRTHFRSTLLLVLYNNALVHLCGLLSSCSNWGVIIARPTSRPYKSGLTSCPLSTQFASMWLTLGVRLQIWNS